MDEEKKVLRKLIHDRLKEMPEEQHAKLSAEIAGRLYGHQVWTAAGTIGITMSRFPEVETRLIIKQAWKEGKQTAVPKCIPGLRKMEFRIIEDFSQLETVYAGLEEPVREQTALIGPADVDLMIVPGLAFTESGCRLGFGGGYYDRYLPEFGGRTAALAFDDQIAGDLPYESHDIPVELIFTPSRIFS